ncbi:MAG: hypothetical protein ACRD0N_12265, partial [Acidimicrobiales bacterium]
PAPSEEPAAAVPTAAPEPRSTAPAPPPRHVPVQRPVRFAASGDRQQQAAPDIPARGAGRARAAAEDNYQRHLERATANGLVRRVPKASLPPEIDRAPAPAPTNSPSSSAADRLPEEVRSLLSSYRSGVQRGRQTGVDDQSPDTQERS